MPVLATAVQQQYHGTDVSMGVAVRGQGDAVTGADAMLDRRDHGTRSGRTPVRDGRFAVAVLIARLPGD